MSNSKTLLPLSAAGAFLGVLLMTPLPAFGDDADRGRALLEAHCARCHAIGLADESPLPEAPPFRILHERYPVEMLEEALAEGIVTGHPEMPEFTFEPSQIGDIVAYLKTLESD